MSSPRPIHVLPDELASQIAAGEVVQRPASVVKELVENSLDAGADRVEVAINAGGIGLIQVSDDGHGMSPEQAPLCLGRHATSKLQAFSDLELLGSYGFRGEALPSVASVSRLTLRTRDQDSEAGVLLSTEGGEEPTQSLVASPVGTTVTVRDLFYNVPVRRKFLRSSNTESGHIGDVVVEAALSRPSVAFSLVRDGRPLKHFERAQSRRVRVSQVFFEEEFIECTGTRGPLTIEAYLSAPERSRQGAGGLKFFVNDRPVRDRALAATVAHAFGPTMERGRYPRGVVYLSLPGRLVDVNVHPQKTEVRFVDPRAVADALHSVIHRAFRGTQVDAGRNESAQTAHHAAAILRPVQELSTTSRPTQPTQPTPRGRSDGGRPISGRRFDRDRPASFVAVQDEKDVRTFATWRGLRLLGSFRQKYFVCEGEEGIFVLDQHAAHERVLLTELRRDFFAGRMATQALLFPETIALDQAETQTLEASREAVDRLGLDVRLRGGVGVSIHSTPRLFQRTKPELLLRQVLSDLREQGGGPESFEPMLARLACVEAVPPGDRVQREMAEGLLRALLGSDFEAKCIHPRVILSEVSAADMERKAGRL